MPLSANRTAPRPVGQTQQGSSVTAKANQRVAHSATSGVRRSSALEKFVGSVRALMTRGLNFVSPGNVRANSKYCVSSGKANHEVGQLLHTLSTQSGSNREAVDRVLVALESTMEPMMTLRNENYDKLLAAAVNRMAVIIRNNPDVPAAREQLANILTRLGEINAPPHVESARISIVKDMVERVRDSMKDRQAI